jgi:redox-sensitive bicupin YhaK (pirin superfamily)
MARARRCSSCKARSASVHRRSLHESIVGHGPFVMDTRDEIAQAMQDFGSGKFGHRAPAT